MLDDTLKAQLQAYLQRVTQPFELVASLANPAAPTETDPPLKQ
jgi:alkyl hydroperoxide reductase subunit F